MIYDKLSPIQKNTQGVTLKSTYEDINQCYTSEYCEILESAYGAGMLSEGGGEAIDRLFHHVDLNGKNLCDIGCGLGGVDFYLIKKHNCRIKAMEINHELVNTARRRLSNQSCLGKIEFLHYHPPLLPIETATIDIVFSKGVLVHESNKTPLFNDIFRILKPRGQLIIDDWLSPSSEKWCTEIKELCETEGLLLHPETEESYFDHLKKAGFTNIRFHDINPEYATYNLNVVEHLEKREIANSFIEKYGTESYEESLRGYSSIASAIKKNTLLIRKIKALKDTD